MFSKHENSEERAYGSHLNLQANEAYEPGFGKYTLTEQDLKFGKINQLEAKKYGATSKPDSNYTSGIQKERIESNKHVSASISNPELREENSSKHNNW